MSEPGLQYSNGDAWDRMLQQGIQLLDRFCQDARIRIRQPRRNLQIKFAQPISAKNDFVAYIDAIGFRRHTVSAGVENHFRPLPRGTRRTACSRSTTGLLFLDDAVSSSSKKNESNQLFASGWHI